VAESGFLLFSTLFSVFDSASAFKVICEVCRRARIRRSLSVETAPALINEILKAC